MSREAMQMALDMLNEIADDVYCDQELEGVITAVRQALAQPEQEPVAWMYVNEDGECEQIEYGPVFDDPGVTPLYTSPPKREWVGLTDEQVEGEWERITGHSIFGGDRSDGRAMYISPNEVIEFSRYIEAKLKEKNHG